MKKRNLWLSLMISLFIAIIIPSTQAVETPGQPGQPQGQPSVQAVPGQSNTQPGQSQAQSVGQKSQAAGQSGGQTAEQAQATPSSPDEALKRLIEGNKRFMENRVVCPAPNRSEERRMETVGVQKPFAIIVGCSDSRVPPEFVFDQGLADIFVVRIAGNVVSDLELDSVEYSVLYNDSKIIMVLGHQNCGAVDAVMKGQTKDIESIATLIEPAIYNAKREKLSLKEAIIANVKNSVDRIQKSGPISKFIQKNKIKVVGAYYDFETGEAQIVTGK